MGLDDLAAGVLLLALIGYAVFGGADLGAGVWVAIARGEDGKRQRSAIFTAMGPVWETNHVWLVLVVVALFTAFPKGFALLFTGLLVPLVVALIALTFRGAALAFRHFAEEGGWEFRGMTEIFSVSSILAPLAMGMSLGAVSAGNIVIESGRVVSGFWGPWLGPFPWVIGLIAVTICAFVTASYMTTRTRDSMQECFRRRALVTGVLLAVLLIVVVPVARANAPVFWAGMSKTNSIAIMVCAAGALATVLAGLWRRWFKVVPALAAGSVGLVIAGWAVTIYPYMIPPNEHLEDVVASATTLRHFLIALAVGAVILVPSLVYLFHTFRGLTEPEEGATEQTY